VITIICNSLKLIRQDRKESQNNIPPLHPHRLHKKEIKQYATDIFNSMQIHNFGHSNINPAINFLRKFQNEAHEKN